MPELTAASLASIELPELHKNLGELKAVREIATDADGVCRVTVALPVPGYSRCEELTREITSALQTQDARLREVQVKYTLDIKGPQSGGSVGLRVKNVIAVGSGKGGVGKSTIAASLAYALQSMGAQVGLLDADVYGPSIPQLTGANGKPEVREHLNPNGAVIQRIHPVMHQGLAIMSIGFLIPEQEAVIWRGPMLHKLLTQFLSETEWGNLDYLIVDMPPGTGDVALTLSQMLSLAGAVVVCTPQKVALLDAVKAIAMYRKVNIPILGMVENMTGELFGRGSRADGPGPGDSLPGRSSQRCPDSRAWRRQSAAGAVAGGESFAGGLAERGGESDAGNGTSVFQETGGSHSGNFVNTAGTD